MVNCHECGERMSTKYFGKGGHAIEHHKKMIQISEIHVCDTCGMYYYKEFKKGQNSMKKLILNPNDVIEITSKGQYGQTMIVEVTNDGIITYRLKETGYK